MIELIARTSVILLAAWGVSLLFARAAAATRHLIWHAAVVAALLAPLLSLALPSYEVAWLPAATTPSVEGSGAQILSTPSTAAPQTNNDASLRAAPGTSGTPDAVQFDTLPSRLWGLGTVAFALWFLTAHIAALRVRRRGNAAQAVVRQLAEEIAAQLAIKTPEVRTIESCSGPFTIGVWWPLVVLPLGADSWERDQLRSVLLHELAHIRRHDCRTNVLAQVAVALYWFNPLIWIAYRALRFERERACDDEVLRGGARPSQYASYLLGIARAPALAHAPAVLGMTRATHLERRLTAILSTRTCRVAAPLNRWVVAAAIATITLPAVAMRGSPSSVQAASQPIAGPPLLASRATFEFPERDSPAAPATPIAKRQQSAPVHSTPADSRERQVLALALDSSADAVPALVAALDDPDGQVREKAALGLAWRSDERAFAPLLKALHDPDPQVREKAAIALGSSGNPNAAGPLLDARDDPDPQVREKAVAGLTLLRVSSDPAGTGTKVRDALRSVVNGLLALADQQNR